MSTIPKHSLRAQLEKRVDEFIDKFDPKHQTVIRQARKFFRKRLARSYEMVYDNYNFFVIGYSPTERPSDAILSIAAASNGVGICFIQGAKLPDPNHMLIGSGKQVRFVRLDSMAVLKSPEFENLIAAAVSKAKVPVKKSGPVELVIRSVSAKQRPRRKKAK